MTTTVVIGSCSNPDYSFPLPLALLLWRDLVGYNTRAFLVGTEEQWQALPARSCLAALRAHGLSFVFVPELPGYSTVAVAKHVRQHAAALVDFANLDWIMPSDADLFPIRREYFHQHEQRAERAVLYFANGDEFQRAETALEGFEGDRRFPTLPMCHTTMRAREWRDVWQLRPGELRASLLATFERCRVGVAGAVPPGETSEGWAWWMDSDQRVSTALLAAQPWFHPRGVHMIWRSKRGGPPDDRLDRARMREWPTVASSAALADRYVDAHIPRAPHGEEGWRVLAPIFEALLPQHAAWARQYRRGWVY